MICLRLSKEWHCLPTEIENMTIDWTYKMLHYSDFLIDYKQASNILNKI